MTVDVVFGKREVVEFVCAEYGYYFFTSVFVCTVFHCLIFLCCEVFEEVAEKALAPILECITDEGVVNQVSYGTPMGRESKNFYKQIEIRQMPYGQALAMLFLIECMNS